MSRKKFIVLFLIIVFVSISAAIYKNLSSSLKKSLPVSTSKVLNKRHRHMSFSSFKGLTFKSDNIKVLYENKDLKLKLPIYYDTNRYYIPLTEIANDVNASYKLNKGTIDLKLNNQNVSFNTQNNSCSKNFSSYKLVKPFIFKDNVLYISAFDFTRLFNLKLNWDIDKKELSFYMNKDASNDTPKAENENGKPAFIRLEDIAAGERYSNAEALEKLRTVCDFLYSQNVPFGIAWVPRYIEPPEKIDNDLSTNYSMYNCDFIYTLDYLQSKNGILGLHGYTHQTGNDISLAGIEFDNRHSNTPKETRERVEAAITAAHKLGFDPAFFESPHYGANKMQHNIMAEYFNIIYEPYGNAKSVITQNIKGKKVIYVPAPLEYIEGSKSVPIIENKVSNLKQNELCSFFCHPAIEFNDIKITSEQNGYHDDSYNDTSILHTLIKFIKDKGYTFKSVTTLYNSNK